VLGTLAIALLVAAILIALVPLTGRPASSDATTVACGPPLTAIGLEDRRDALEGLSRLPTGGPEVEPSEEDLEALAELEDDVRRFTACHARATARMQLAARTGFLGLVALAGAIYLFARHRYRPAR
jgi:hypothetical protein